MTELYAVSLITPNGQMRARMMPDCPGVVEGFGDLESVKAALANEVKEYAEALAFVEGLEEVEVTYADDGMSVSFPNGAVISVASIGEGATPVITH